MSAYVSVQKFNIECPQPRTKLLNFSVTGTTGVQQVSQVVCVDDVAKSLNSTYFTISTPTEDFYVWLDVDDTGVDPAVADMTGIEVDIAEDDVAATVAAAVAAAIDGLSSFSAAAVAATVTVTNAADGVATQAADGADATGFTITTPTAGVDSAVALGFGKFDASIAESGSGPGDYTITFDEPFIQAPHVIVSSTSARAARVVSSTKSAIRIATRNLSGTLIDSNFHVLVFGSLSAEKI